MPDSWDYSQKAQRENTLSQIPFITYGLVALSVVITLAYNYADRSSQASLYLLGHFGYKTSLEVWDGKYYGLLTSFFIHANLMHLLFNMLWLVRLGRVMEFTMNPLAYIGFMIGATIVSNCAELALFGHTGIGASGAVYAMFGLLWAGKGYHPEWRSVATRENLNLFIVWGVLCIILTYTGVMPVANAAHFGGLLFGFSIGWLFYSPRRQPLWAIPLGLLLVISVLSVTWLPWSWMWLFWKGNKAFEQQRYSQAITYYRQSLKLGGDRISNWHNIIGAWHNDAILEEQAHHHDAALNDQKEEEAAKGEAGPDVLNKMKEP